VVKVWVRLKLSLRSKVRVLMPPGAVSKSTLSTGARPTIDQLYSVDPGSGSPDELRFGRLAVVAAVRT
jgi:hypothetical protein